jgi:transposase
MRRKSETDAEERGRWSSKKKMNAVLRILKGEDLDLLSRELKVNAATLSSWRDVFLANGLAGLKSREVDARDEKIGALQKALGETTLNLEISKEINRVYERKHGPLAPGKSTK